MAPHRIGAVLAFLLAAAACDDQEPTRPAPPARATVAPTWSVGAGPSAASTTIGDVVDIGELTPDGGALTVMPRMSSTGVVAGYQTVTTAFGSEGHVARWTEATGQLQDLGVPPGCVRANLFPFDLNAAGAIVGYVQCGADATFSVNWTRAFRWTPDGGFVLYPGLEVTPSPVSYAFAVNAAGEMAGFVATTSTYYLTRWDASGSATTGVYAMPYTSNSVGGALDKTTFINAGGTVAATFTRTTTANPSGGSAVAVWERGDLVREIGTLGGSGSWASGLNDDGVVVGWSFPASGTGTRAFRWTRATGMVDLGTLGGSESRAVGVANDGTVYGWSSTNGQLVRRPFRWRPAVGVMEAIRLPSTWPADAEVTVTAVSPNGTVAGDAFGGGNFRRAFRWTEAEGIVDLSTVTTSHATATAVNDAGQVAGRWFTTTQRWVRWNRANRPPVAAANGLYAAEGAPVTLNAAGSADPDGDPLTYAWSFGDGGAATSASAAHTYTAAGTYTIALTVSDGRGGTSTKQQAITVLGVALGVVAQFDPGLATDVPSTLRVRVTNPASAGDAVTASIDWGDGSSSPLVALVAPPGGAPAAALAHVYTQPGYRTVVVTVGDNLGQTGAATVMPDVPLTDAMDAPNEPCVPGGRGRRGPSAGRRRRAPPRTP